MKDLVLVSDWEKVESDDYYLSDDWDRQSGGGVAEAKKLQKEGKLFIGYIVPALSYVIYTQMDSDQVFIDEEADVILHCETTIINNSHEHREKYLL